MKELRGIFTALLTPFDENNKINEKSLEELVKLNLKMGVRGFYVGGTTAEAFFLTTEERKQIMEIVKATAPDATLIAHIGSLDERAAIELGKHANKLSYDLVSSVAPFYFKYSFQEIKNYYFRLANASELPMLVYHFPGYSGVNMNVNEIGEFLSDDRFAGLKFTSNEFFTMERCKTAFPDKVVYNGFDEMFLCGLSMGADGGIGSTYNFMADKYVEMLKLFQENNIAEARNIQVEANAITEQLIKYGVMQSEKAVLSAKGIPMGQCRDPFGKLEGERLDAFLSKVLPLLEA